VRPIFDEDSKNNGRLGFGAIWQCTVAADCLWQAGKLVDKNDPVSGLY
jgi:hypothetical protein